MPNESKKQKRRLHSDEILLALGLFLLLLFAVIEIVVHCLPSYSLNALTRSALLISVCILLYCGARLHLHRTKSARLLHHTFLLFFCLYLYLIVSFTLIDPTLGRSGSFLYNNMYFVDKRQHYIDCFVNLIPFQTIDQIYITGFVKGYVSAYYMLFNLLGNIFAFMPFAFFLPLFFKKQRKWYVFLPTVLGVVILIEASQFLFMVGSCDVDDVILNVGGAMIFFFLLRIPLIQRICKMLVKDSFDR